MKLQRTVENSSLEKLFLAYKTGFSAVFTGARKTAAIKKSAVLTININSCHMQEKQ